MTIDWRIKVALAALVTLICATVLLHGVCEGKNYTADRAKNPRFYWSCFAVTSIVAVIILVFLWRH